MGGYKQQQPERIRASGWPFVLPPGLKPGSQVPETCVALHVAVMSPRQDSNLERRYRKPKFYPLNYEGWDLILLFPYAPTTQRHCKVQGPVTYGSHVHPPGLEPGTAVPKTDVISFSPRVQFGHIMILAQKRKSNVFLLQSRP